MVFAVAVALAAQGAAQWIWASGDPIPPNVYFRSTVTLAGEPQSGRLDITCDDAYELLVNGKKVASHASWYTMQTVDLKPLLHRGRNVLAVAGRNFESQAGLLVRGSVVVSGKTVALNSDAGWRVSMTAAPGWDQVDFDDSGWASAKVIGPEGIDPWGRPKSEDDLVRELLSIKTAKPTATRKPAAASPDVAEGYTWPKAMTGVKGRWVRLAIPPVAMDSKIGDTISKPRTLKIDFGREIAGWVEVEVEGANAPDAVIRVGEAQTPQGQFPTNAEHIGNRTIYRLLPTGSFTGFRFAWIDFSNVTAPIKVRRVEAIWRMWPANYEGSFECSDPLLNKIWHIGAYTAHINLDPVAFSAILRPDRGDRFPWMGDDRVTQRTVMTVFGNYDHAKADLAYYVKPGQKDIALNNIPGYTLDWVIALHSYWLYSGDGAFARARLADVRTILDSLNSEDTPQGWLFTDWEPELASTSDKSVLAFHFKYVHAAKVAAEMAAKLGSPQMGAEFKRLGDARAAFLAGRLSGLPQHALTNALLAGYKLEFPESMRGHTDTPYFSNYVLEALSKAGKDAKALGAIRTVWGGMVKLGATSTWEYYLPEWLKTLKPLQQPPDVDAPQLPKFFVSLCHPWSTGATPWLSERVLGVTPTAPGFSECEVRPFFGDLAWAKGSVPTPHGKVRVSWTRKAGALTVRVQAPTGVRLKLVLPKGRYRVDGKPAANDGSVGFRFKDSKEHTVSGTTPS
jgi:alpha-L-rhamnosidase